MWGMNVQDDCAGCVSCFVCLLFGCVYIAATETTANQLQCWKPAWRTDQKGGNQVRYMRTHEQKRQRIHDYDANDSYDRGDDDGDGDDDCNDDELQRSFLYITLVYTVFT